MKRGKNPYTWARTIALWIGALMAMVSTGPTYGADKLTLDNGVVLAEFEKGQLVRLRDRLVDRTVEFANGSGAVTIDGERLSTSDLGHVAAQGNNERLTFTYPAGQRKLQVVYELKRGWRFVTKHVCITLPEGVHARVDAVDLLRAELRDSVADEYRLDGGKRGVFLRLGKQGEPSTAGLFATLQNPFLEWRHEGNAVSMGYQPQMEWKAEDGPFVSDRACLGLYRPTGVRLPAHPLPEWKYVREPEKLFAGGPYIDQAEIDALSGCVQAFVLAPLQRSLRVHVGWCENDYQIDVATPEGRTEYKRILDQAAAVGCDHVLFAPANSDVSRLPDNADAWGWENLLWLGLGQKIRRGEWNIDKDPLPPSIQEMLDYAQSKQVRLLAYVYPTLGWKQDPEWTQWCGGKTGGYVGVDAGVRSFQDWFVDQLVAFQKRTGIAGYSFDHWWIAYEAKDQSKPTSKYAQWYGCRRIMEELRRRVPDIVIDGRQQYQWFGPWTWLGGSYPHPTMNDEQAGSFVNFPDLHFDRVSADRQRFAAWYYRVSQCTPVELIPGYMTHQTGRIDDQGRCLRTRFRARDWDVLGWRYSVIASLGTAPLVHTVSMLPARDEAEFRAFSPADQAWLRGWMDWTDQNAQTLRQMRAILGPPTLGRIDGTAAVQNDHGFVFLFNPNYRALDAEFRLDASIGLTKGKNYTIRELYPQKDRLAGKPHAGLWDAGDTVRLPVKGPQALVLEILPAEQLPRPALLGVRGKASLRGSVLVLSDVQGEMGTRTEVVALLPPGQEAKSVSVNGREIRSFQCDGDVVRLPLAFAGAPFEHCPQVGSHDPAFTGRVVHSSLTIPARVFAQLKRRPEAWPVPYTPDELRAAYLGSDRLLLFVQIAEPKDTMAVQMTIDGQPIEIRKAYSGVSADARERTFVGFYADISRLAPDATHEIEVRLPELQPGQYQGLFVENVEAEFTSQIVP